MALITAGVLVIFGFKWYNKSHSHIHLLMETGGKNASLLFRIIKRPFKMRFSDNPVLIQMNFEVFGKVQVNALLISS